MHKFTVSYLPSSSAHLSPLVYIVFLSSTVRSSSRIYVILLSFSARSSPLIYIVLVCLFGSMSCWVCGGVLFRLSLLIYVVLGLWWYALPFVSFDLRLVGILMVCSSVCLFRYESCWVCSGVLFRLSPLMHILLCLWWCALPFFSSDLLRVEFVVVCWCVFIVSSPAPKCSVFSANKTLDIRVVWRAARAMQKRKASSLLW